MVEDNAFELEQILFAEQNVWFYQVPSIHVSSLSPRADAWDPEHPFMTGSLQVVQKGDHCWIKLYEPIPKDSGSIAGTTNDGSSSVRTLLACCPIKISSELGLEVYVQDCADSSRYFMIRVEDENTTRCAYIGAGFPERTSAFNFKAALQDYVKYVHRQTTVSDNTSGKPSNHLSIPKGSTIRINLKVNNNVEHLERQRVGSNDNKDGKVPLLPPPPAAQTNTPNNTKEATTPNGTTKDEDWGDFTSA